MALALDVLKWVFLHWAELLGALAAVLASLTGLFILIPGPHPEDWIEKANDVIKRISRK